MNSTRRVVTGLDEQGRSCILIDGPSTDVIWRTESAPTDNSSMADAGGVPFTFDLPVGGTQLAVHEFPPGAGAFMHATDSLDYAIVTLGEIVFVTETGEASLRVGDVVVNRGSYHGWRNDSDGPCRLVSVVVKALPLGKGATI
jgi:quercetin dioxygenase-like cupin family protein